MKKEVVKEIISTILYFLGVLLLAFLIVKFVIQRTEVDGESMEPTLNNGENLMVDKITYRFRNPKRFEIIVFQPYENDPETLYIKRVIGLPGETVQILEDGSILINDQKLDESYGKEVILPHKRELAASKITLGEDEYFVLGDNRNNSTDSRVAAVGNVEKKQIVGKSWIRIWPMSKFGSVEKKK